MPVIRSETQHADSLDAALNSARRKRDLLNKKTEANKPAAFGLQAAEAIAPLAGTGIGAAIGAAAGNPLLGASIGGAAGAGVGGLAGLLRGEMGAEQDAFKLEQERRRQRLFQLAGMR